MATPRSLSSTRSPARALHRATHALPAHLADWQLPTGWRWGAEGAWGEHRHFQEIVDALDRSLSLVSVPEPAHYHWLAQEARYLAHRGHPSIPTTYHFWVPAPTAAGSPGPRRGPGYLRRWIVGDTITSRIATSGPEDLTFVLRYLRVVAPALAYMHSSGTAHGNVSGENVWVTPAGLFWLLGWQWAMPRTEIPEGMSPDRAFMPIPPEWGDNLWNPTPSSDQWQLAATAFAALTGEYPPANDPPPVLLAAPELPHSVAAVLDKALNREPRDRFDSVAALLRQLDRSVGSRTSIYVSGATTAASRMDDSEEARLRWATGEDYEVIARLGSGTFGSVWRVRDLALEREVALKMLHPDVARDEAAVRRFRREARLAAQLAHPAIVPIYDFDTTAGVAWYTMELAEGGSVADLVKRSGPRTLEEVAPQIENVLDGLAAAHAGGVIHRDIKPENILIDRYRRWRLGDFGVAKIPGEERLGSTTGTPEFAAPEQLLGEHQGPAVDCFEIAAVTYFLLSGVAPFGSGDGRAILARELSGDVDLSHLAEPIAAWLRKGLAPNPDERFADAAEMQGAWREAVEAVLDEGARIPWWRRWLTSAGANA